jgi:flagellar motor switch protein FliN/FliY
MTNQERDPVRRAAQEAASEQDGGVATEVAPQDAPPFDTAPKRQEAAAPPCPPALEDISSERGSDTLDPAPSAPARSTDRRSINLLMDVDLTVTAELGRTRMTIGQIVSLSAGSIIPLSKVAGETVDLRINGKLFASGEVIVVDGNFAVKITKLLSKEERV